MDLIDPVFNYFPDKEREAIVLDLLDLMLSCDRLLITCETDPPDDTALRSSTIQGNWTAERLRYAHNNAMKAFRFTLANQDANNAVEELLNAE